ncbi:hypothetical protein GALMADRAFT_238256 [Galerina marginata CBS 339.88]|uniref:POP1-domain-containing protein n=1 Tax=Galerina marginata (strain CBS 339.88) TaxID=685588 RepID=A0A067TK82_GALM3|nr:hypothetical protein GALMADRAFT_238256 [Galerina marginata CBS 339.88]
MTGREKKKLKISAARTIPIQSSSRGAKTLVSRGSNSIPTSLTGLPSAIDVEKFVEARAFEIDAMHTAMTTASASSTHRVWQTLPRHLRRRAASHDVRRVPLRLRDRARAEMDPVRKKALGRSMPKRGKDKRIGRTESFLKRQNDKTWLETHLWHAKRMHMDNIWGYRLAISPTEKSYRPSHRASIHGSILHDASYYSLVEIACQESLLITMLNLFCDPQGPGPGSKRYLSGSRVLETYIYKVASYPYDLVAPVTIIWKPLSKATSDPEVLNQSSASKKGKGKETQHSPANDSTQSNSRSVWLRFHPSAKTAVVDILKQAASNALASYKITCKDGQEAILEIADLTGQINVFEIMGPKSSQVIKGALSPVSTEIREDFSQFWSSLTNLQSSGSVPRGMVIGFKVNDPRLRFPPKNAKPSASRSGNAPPANIILPSVQLASSEIWDDTTRNGLSKPRFKKKDIDERRAKNEIPGTPLSVLRQDDRIPILLIQRSIESSTSSDNQAIHGWTLVVPAGWSMAFFNSLIFTGTRVAGQLERQTQAYEAATPYFPRDFPFTESYENYARDREEKDRDAWTRKPPAKRVNYDKINTINPWRADWESILGIANEKRQDSEVGTSFVPSQREPGESADVTQQQIVRPWLLRGSEVPKILSTMSSMFSTGAGLLSEINRQRLKRGHEYLPKDIKPADLLRGSLINVKVTLCLRGAPQDLAVIYSLSDDLIRRWGKLIHTRNLGMVGGETPEEFELANLVPENTAIIGHVTTGHYSLARGHGFAIGAISVTHLLELEQQGMRLHANQRTKSPLMLVVVRNPDGQQCRVAHLEVLLDV